MQVNHQQAADVVNLHDRRCWQWDLDDLQGIIPDLASAGHISEQGFLEFGSNIKLFHERAHGISQTAGAALQLLQGDAGENTLQQLQKLVERCDLWLASSIKKSTKIRALLKGVSRQIAGLDQPVAGLRKVIKTLHALRVSTRIEAAKKYASGANVLASSLDELGTLVQEKISAIFTRVKDLVPLIERSLQMEESAQSGTKVVAGHEVQQARHMLGTMITNCIETGRRTDQLKERSGEVKQSFGEMIAALQSQDITRQRIDHVQVALTNLVQHLEKFSLSGDASGDEEVSRLFGRICRLQHDQLHLACEEFLAATDLLAENLHLMIASVIAMAADTRELSRATGVGAEYRYDAVLDVLRAVTDCLFETHEIHLSAGAHLAEVCQGIKEVSVLVTEIELIGEEMQLLAMNAAINAAHARQRGAGLDIIAQNIHAVADEATGCALTLARECLSITGHASQLQDLERDMQANAGGVGSLLEEARQRMATIERNASRLMGMAADVDQTAARLAVEVGQAVKMNDVQADFQQTLAPVLNRLDKLGQAPGAAAATVGSTNLDVLFKALEHCYTMDSERRVHQKFSDKKNPLMTGLSTDSDPWSAHRHHNLGDNVDLF